MDDDRAVEAVAGGAGRPVASAADEDAGPVADDNAVGPVAKASKPTSCGHILCGRMRKSRFRRGLMSGITRLRSASAVSESLSYLHAHELVEISQAGEDGIGSTFAYCPSSCLRHGDEAATLFLLDEYGYGNVFIIVVVIIVVIPSLLRRM